MDEDRRRVSAGLVVSVLSMTRTAVERTAGASGEVAAASGGQNVPTYCSRMSAASVSPEPA